MRGTWVEERFPRYVIFGQSPDGHYVDISDGERDIAQHVPRDTAEAIIREHNRLVEQLVDMAIAFDDADHEAFHQLWYGFPAPQTHQ